MNTIAGKRTLALLWYVPAAAWAAFLLYLGTQTFDGTFEPYDLPWDKVAHLGLYGVLGGLAVIGWRRAGRWPHMLVPLSLAVAVGLVDELRQRGVPTRSADPFDFLADMVGVVLAFAILSRARKTEEVQ
ncbi:MAG TPA: VanZ family protein [Longimicrobiales bacterium]|nr:VanZ family protein [Longimicrobiales bacterium]